MLHEVSQLLVAHVNSGYMTPKQINILLRCILEKAGKNDWRVRRGEILVDQRRGAIRGLHDVFELEPTNGLTRERQRQIE